MASAVNAIATKANCASAVGPAMLIRTGSLVRVPTIGIVP